MPKRKPTRWEDESGNGDVPESTDVQEETRELTHELHNLSLSLSNAHTCARNHTVTNYDVAISTYVVNWKS